MAFWAAAGAAAKKIVIAEATSQAVEQTEDVLWPVVGITLDALLTAVGAAGAIAIIGTLNVDNLLPDMPSIGFMSASASQPAAAAGDDMFDIAYEFSSQWEGSGCSYHPADVGGLTCFGVAQNYSSSNVAALGAEGAKAEIKRRAWDDPNCGQYSAALAIVCLDTNLNFGSWDWVVDEVGLDAMAIVRARKAYRHKRVAETPSQQVFLNGWLNRDNDLESYIQQYL